MRRRYRSIAFALLAACWALAAFLNAAARPLAETPATRGYQAPPAASSVLFADEELALLLKKLEALPAEECPGGSFVPLDGVPLSAALQRDIYDQCAEAGVPFPVVMGLIWQESRFQPAVVSQTGDHGLMQVNQGNFGWLRRALGGIDFYDPIQNVRAGLHILGPLWAEYGAEEPEKALMAYNLGPAGAARRWANGQCGTAYSRGVMRQAAAYGFALQ